ncbi:MAG: hypothetical protein GC137_07190 [Alphaproteobacteria bacterium]|nr:hypothetical protein [Alphaproteobacteria bacterium]
MEFYTRGHNPKKRVLPMYFLFGRSIPLSLARYFTHRSKQDGHTVVHASMGEFADSEPFAELNFDPAGTLTVLFQSITQAGGFNASSHYMQMLACADNLKRHKARGVWAVNPLGGFMRQDRVREGRRESMLSHLSGRLMAEAGIDGLSTVEAHSEKAIENYEEGLGKGNVLNIHPNRIFKHAVERAGLAVTSVANPDLGADERGEALAAMLGATRFEISKERQRSGTRIVGYEGALGECTALVDDMASSLGTAKNAIELIYNEGSKTNILLLSHPIMVGQAWDNLAKLITAEKLERVFFLPTIAREAEFTAFEQQYGPDVANKIVFLDDDYNALIYDHVTRDIAQHPRMAPGV